MRRARERDRASIRNCECSNVREQVKVTMENPGPRTQDPHEKKGDSNMPQRDREGEKDSEEAPSVREHHQPGVEHDLRERIDSMSMRAFNVHIAKDNELTGNKI